MTIPEPWPATDTLCDADVACAMQGMWENFCIGLTFAPSGLATAAFLLCQTQFR